MKKKILIVFLIFLILMSGGVCYFGFIQRNENGKIEIIDTVSRVNEIREKEKIIPLEEIDESRIELVNQTSAFYKNDISDKNFIAEQAEYIIIGTVRSPEPRYRRGSGRRRRSRSGAARHTRPR